MYYLLGITDPTVKSNLTSKVRQYIEKAEALKRVIDAEKKKPQGYHEQIAIQEGATGYGLEKVFRDYLDEELTEVEIDDPYIRAHHQVSKSFDLAYRFSFPNAPSSRTIKRTNTFSMNELKQQWLE